MGERSKTVDYVKNYLSSELNAVANSPIATVISSLSIEERTIIYKYTEDGYQDLNESLRINLGTNNTVFGKILDNILKKLSDYKGLVYRSVDLTDNELGRYIDAYNKNTILVEYSFISASKSILVANMFGNKCRFTIISNTGKEIENFAKYGVSNAQNEKEVLFRPNRRFKVLAITNNSNQTLISMEEV